MQRCAWEMNSVDVGEKAKLCSCEAFNVTRRELKEKRGGARGTRGQPRGLAILHPQLNSRPHPPSARDFFLFVGDSAISNTTTPSIPSPWPPRSRSPAPLRRTSPWAPRSARVRNTAIPQSATCDYGTGPSSQEEIQRKMADGNNLQASSSLALPASSPPSTTPSSTSPIFRTSEPPPALSAEISRSERGN